VRTFRAPEGPFRAVLRVPGDKSLSHRALIFAAMAAGRSRVVGLGSGDDIAATERCLEALGVSLAGDMVDSPGVSGWTRPDGPLDAGNSGTTLRLLAGALAGRPFRCTLVGDESLMTRPMRRIADSLALLGASIETGAGGTPPVTVGGGGLHGARVQVPMASAQVRSAVALAALQAEGESTIDSPGGFRDHTERWLVSLGRGHYRSETSIEIDPGPLPATEYPIPGDLSSASYLLAAAALRPQAEVAVRAVTLNPGRTGFLDVLERMGAKVQCRFIGEVHGDPVGDVSVTGAALHGVDVDGELAVRTLDELPLVAVLGAVADGATQVSGAAELRVKESDRVATSVALVRALGGDAEERPDGFTVAGMSRLGGGEVDAAGDHRIAMAAAVAAVACDAGVGIRGFEASSVSWPDFGTVLEQTWSSP
jgi:3-phosphoshikimate 1-carboxyvinyltransferase